MISSIMKIRIESQDFDVILKLRNGPVPEGVSIEVAPGLLRGGISITGLKSPVAIVSVAPYTPISLLTNWLYDKMKDKPARLIINHTVMQHIEKDEITKVLQAYNQRGLFV